MGGGVALIQMTGIWLDFDFVPGSCISLNFENSTFS